MSSVFVPTFDLATAERLSKMPPMPGSPFRSKLVPFEDLIRELRAAHTPYRDIAKILKEKHGIEAHADTINSFVIVRAKRPQMVYTLPPKRQETPANGGEGPAEISPSSKSRKDQTRAKVDAAKTKIKANQKRTAPRDPAWEKFATHAKPGPHTLDAKASK
jgi:hypothetical protein